MAMRNALRIAGMTIALSGAMLLTACSKTDNSTLDVVTIGKADSPFERGSRLSLTGQLVRAATAEGLVSLDEQGRIIPAIADRWIVTDDGKSYIFRLRDGTWLDGSELTARSVQAALRRAIHSLRGTSFGLDLSGIDDIRVMTGRVIEIDVAYPMPDLLQMLAQPELGLLRGRKGSGPMRMKREGDTAVLTPINPEDLGLPAVDKWKQRARTLRLSALSGKDAVNRFNDGKADLLLGGRIQNFPLTSSVGMLRGTIQIDPVIGLFGLAVMDSDGFLSSPDNREAIAMAIDRNALISPFDVSGWTASTQLVPAIVKQKQAIPAPHWASLTMDKRRALAKARVDRWRAAHGKHNGKAKDKTNSKDKAKTDGKGKANGEPLVQLRIGLPDGPGSDILFTQLKQDLNAIGIEAQRVEPDDKPDLRLLDDVARFPRAIWFLDRLNCTANRSLCDEKADKLVAQSRAANDPAQRATLLAKAETEMTTANVFIPFGSPIRWSLVRGDVNGFSPNRWGWHPLMPMALLPE